MIPSRVDSVHRGGSKRARESNAALGEQRFWSSPERFLDGTVYVMSQTTYVVDLEALDC